MPASPARPGHSVSPSNSPFLEVLVSLWPRLVKAPYLETGRGSQGGTARLPLEGRTCWLCRRVPVTLAGLSWHIAGSYLESCNCDAPCPCRKIAGVPGGRSTYGICLGALSWHIERGNANGHDLSGLSVALASRYSDDEEGSPWTFVLYVDERGDATQRQALEEIFTGRLGGEVLDHFPWAWKPSNLVGVQPAEIELDHTPRRQWFRVKDALSVRIRGPLEEDVTITCVIPGHDQQGEELVADELKSQGEPPLAFEFTGNCAYAAPFDYRSR